MMIIFLRSVLVGENGRRWQFFAAAIAVNVRSMCMKWETPQAVDFRFGMEITMYIANR